MRRSAEAGGPQQNEGDVQTGHLASRGQRIQIDTVPASSDIRLHQELWGWRTSRIDDAQDIKGAIAELHAAIGPDLANDLVVSFS